MLLWFAAVLAALGLPLIVYGVVAIVSADAGEGLAMLAIGGLFVAPFAWLVQDEL